MKGADHYTVYRFMTRELGLRGAELQVFALIYSFTVAVGEFSGSRAYVADTVGVTERTVDRALRELCQRGLIVRGERRCDSYVRSFITVPQRALSLIGELCTEAKAAV